MFRLFRLATLSALRVKNLLFKQASTNIYTVPRLITRLFPSKKIVSGAQLNPVSRRGVNHALHQADENAAERLGPGALPRGPGRDPAFQLRVRDCRSRHSKPHTATIATTEICRSSEHAAFAAP
jgi:hypothetical protein